MLIPPLLALVLLFPFPSILGLPTPTSLREGLTYYPCTNSSQCISPLQCTDGRSSTCPQPPCFCLPSSNRVRLCLSSDVCPPGELCASSSLFEKPFCIDAQHVQSNPSLQPFNPPTITPSPTGLAFDLCPSDSACIPDYVCLLDNGLPCPSGFRCRCFPPDGPMACPTTCRPGEMCAAGAFIPEPVCVSETVIQTETGIFPVTQGPASSPPTPRPDGTGVAFDSCRADSECRVPRRCFKNVETLCTDLVANGCLCQYTQGIRECGDADDCGEGEGCFRAMEGASFVCISIEVARDLENLERLEPSMEPTVVEPSMEPTVESEGVCVDAELLEGWDGGELVFERDAYARVLCDVEGSCATSGHMVVWNGGVMRMRRYCDEVGCERRAMRVNSPRWRRGRRVRTRTKGLEFTAFAARLDTWAEEAVLAAVVRLGL